jgi:uncharacterized protein YecT (DUF1311 family)
MMILPLVVSLLIGSAPMQVPRTPCDAPNLTQEQLETCLDKESAAADDELNRVYKQVLASFSPYAQEALRVSERAWIKYRDADMKLRYTLASGNHPDAEMLTEQIKMCRERTAFLRSLPHNF